METAASDVDKDVNQREAIRKARLAIFETQDPIEVLEARNLHTETTEDIVKARATLREAISNIRANELKAAAENLKGAISLFEQARRDMVKGIP